MDALNNENLENQGAINDNVGQDEEGIKNNESEDDWQSQAKYFQSEKDKLYSENQNLKKYEKIGKFLESRPDIVEKIQQDVGSGKPGHQENRVELEKDEFDPWEAYNDPTSKSYKFRQQEMTDTINNQVTQKVGEQVSQMQTDIGMNKLDSELDKRGLSPEQKQSFVEFAKTNPSEYGIDGYLKMWEAVSETPEQIQQKQSDALNSIRQNKSIPQQGGVLNGQQPSVESSDSAKWKSILGASRVGNKIP